MVPLGRVRGIVWHHSATRGGSVEAFRHEHKQRGFEDIGYHFVIGNGLGMGDGEIQVGRSLKYQGAGVAKNNRGFVHVCVVGNFELGPPTPAQLATIGVTAAGLNKQFGQWAALANKPGDIWCGPPNYGHNQVALPGHGTLCPGKHFPIAHLQRWVELPTANRPRFDNYLAVHVASTAAVSGSKSGGAAVTTAAPPASPAKIARVKIELERGKGRYVRCAVLEDDRCYIHLRDLCELANWTIIPNEHGTLLVKGY